MFCPIFLHAILRSPFIWEDKKTILYIKCNIVYAFNKGRIKLRNILYKGLTYFNKCLILIIKQWNIHYDVLFCFVKFKK